MKDFIIVGHGLAAHVLMHTFKTHGLSFTTVGNNTLSSCSRVAAGIWNPVVFKRATRSWLAEDLIPTLNEFYGECETALGKKIIIPRDIIKPFVEEQEKNLWIKKSGTDLAGFIDPIIHMEIPGTLAHCNIQNGYGVVLQAGNLNVAEFLDLSSEYFDTDILTETFDYTKLEIFDDKVLYRDVSAKQIIFCEGYLVKNNPYFKWIPLKPAKGELLTISAPQLKLKNTVFNKNGFLMDTRSGEFRLGATYEWQELNESVTQKGKAELEEKARSMIDCDFLVLKHEAGVRPSSLDRRPVIGRHPRHNNLFVFNGLGTKGVMLAPYFSKNFVNFYLQKEALNADVDVKRFYNLYE